jgi:hypothetical protein
LKPRDPLEKMGGISPEFGALFGSKRAIRAAEIYSPRVRLFLRSLQFTSFPRLKPWTQAGQTLCDFTMTPPSSTATSTFAVLGGVRTTLKRGSVVPLRPSAATRTALRQSRPQGPGDGPSPHRDVQRPEPTTLTGAQETQRPPGNSDRIRLLAHWWETQVLIAIRPP